LGYTKEKESAWRRGKGTEEIDREAQAHTAIVFLAPIEIYLAALGPDSLAP